MLHYDPMVYIINVRSVDVSVNVFKTFEVANVGCSSGRHSCVADDSIGVVSKNLIAMLVTYDML